MRKIAPALIVTTLFAFASTSALAMGDRAKEKKATSTPAAMPTQPVQSTATTRRSLRSATTPYTSRSAMPKECFDKEVEVDPANQSGSTPAQASARCGRGPAQGRGPRSSASSGGDSK